MRKLLARWAAWKAARRRVNDQLARDDQALGSQLDNMDRRTKETDR
jgi:hypothetical protein